MKLIRTHDGRWAEPTPRTCANGHRLVAGTVLVGWDGHKRRTWTCLTCQAVTTMVLT